MQEKSEFLFQSGIENFRRKNFSEAEKCFEELKNIHPTNKDILKIYLFVISKITNLKIVKI